MPDSTPTPLEEMPSDPDAQRALSSDELDEEYEEELDETDGLPTADAAGGPVRRKRRKRRQPKSDAAELRLLGRRDLCKTIIDVAPAMQNLVKRRVLGDLAASRRMEDDDLTNQLKNDAAKLADKARVLNTLNTPDENFDRGQLKSIMLAVLLQEETHSCPENRLDEKVIEFEKEILKAAKDLKWDELKKQDPDRWHHLDTYRIVLDAAWSNDNIISPDEARLLAVLRGHLNISMDEHWRISAKLKRFPKEKSAIHTLDEINDARKELQRDAIVWSYSDEDNRRVDLIPFEIASIIRQHHAGQELQRTNYCRLLHFDGITLAEVKTVLQSRGFNRYGTKDELIERIIDSDIKPSEVLGDLERDKLSSMCAFFGLKAYANKAELIQSLIDFYDDLTFEERTTRDEREVWYNNYELLAHRSYAELRAKKLITKDLDIEHMFEAATEFLFKCRLCVPCDRKTKDNRADGKLPLDNDQSILWDCKSVEELVNLQDHLDDQFDSYLRKERDSGKHPLAFLVIGPGFTPQSIKLATQYKAKTNWDIALITAEGLKHLAERWAATEPGKPFPVRLLNRTDVIDKERAEFLLSLA